MMGDHSKLIAMINSSDDVAKLKNWVANAEREGATDVADAARRRIIAVEASPYLDDQSDPVVLDFWTSITALEFALSDERGKTTRLSRTRQKIARVGVHKTLVDLALNAKPSDGFFLLRDRDMLDLAAEAIVLRYPERFDKEVRQAATARLDAG